MSFSALIATLRDERLIDLAEAWNHARGTAKVPRWRDLDIARMKSCIPFVWAWEYDLATGISRGKLAGEEILRVCGRGLRGAVDHEYFAGLNAPVILARHRKVVFDGLGKVTTGEVYASAKSHAMGQRIALPVATRSDAPDTILGATIYDFGGPLSQGLRAQRGRDEPVFFTLEHT